MSDRLLVLGKRKAALYPATRDPYGADLTNEESNAKPKVAKLRRPLLLKPESKTASVASVQRPAAATQHKAKSLLSIVPNASKTKPRSSQSPSEPPTTKRCVACSALINCGPSTMSLFPLR